MRRRRATDRVPLRTAGSGAGHIEDRWRRRGLMTRDSDDYRETTADRKTRAAARAGATIMPLASRATSDPGTAEGARTLLTAPATELGPPPLPPPLPVPAPPRIPP